jgi:hypothetical protein
MNENQGAREKEQIQTVGKEKKPYRKPTFRYEQVFETQALSCTKPTGPPGGSCMGPKKS